MLSQKDLEKKGFELKGKDINILTESDLRILLMYEMWSDGMDWKDVQNIETDTYWTKTLIIQYLQSCFGY